MKREDAIRVMLSEVQEVGPDAEPANHGTGDPRNEEDE